jgi:AcrR family transcriptional regulator
MNGAVPSGSPRRQELLERAYQYALKHGLADLSLRPLAAAIGSSPRVLLFLFGSKDGLIRALLARARADELAYLEQARISQKADLADTVRVTWQWSNRPTRSSATAHQTRWWPPPPPGPAPGCHLDTNRTSGMPL